MSHETSETRLLSVEIERFKSYEQATRIDLKPLTIILGRNNSGKSTLIQALLLLKQTLEQPRSSVPIHTAGPFVDAINLRELTFGWPEGEHVRGPRIALRWASRIDMERVLDAIGPDDIEGLVKAFPWLKDRPEDKTLETEIVLYTAEIHGRPVIEQIELVSRSDLGGNQLVLTATETGWTCTWNKTPVAVEVELDYFLPYLRPGRRTSGRRGIQALEQIELQQTCFQSYLLLFAQPVEALKEILDEFFYLGSTRTLPSTLYRPAAVPPEDVGASGEYAAQLLQSRQGDIVHYLPPIVVTDNEVTIPDRVQARTFVDAVNDVLRAVAGLDADLRVEDISNLGFRLFFGRASLTHVGRGLLALLPFIELGLLADPLRFIDLLDEDWHSLDGYRAACRGCAHIAVEEPEAHIHPKAQTRLAHWMVSLAMASRQLIVETHSDHLVRRLRGLMARAPAGSPLEAWLRENVAVIEVEQDADGRSRVKTSHLTARGMLEEHWPADFMDEASAEESAILYAAMDKPREEPSPQAANFEHDSGEEPEPEDAP